MTIVDAILGKVLALAEGDRRYISPATTRFTIPVDRPSGVIKAMRNLVAYGNSEFADNGNASVNGWDRLLTTIRPQAWFNGAVNGYTMPDVLAISFGTLAIARPGSSNGVSQQSIGVGTFSHKAFSGGVVLLKCVRNDARRDLVVTGGESSANAQLKSRTGFARHVETFVRLARAQYRIGNATSLSSTTTSGSPVVNSTAVTAGLRGMPVTGAGIPAGSYIGTVTAGVSYRLSASPSTQIDVNATASATITATVAAARTGTWVGNVSGPDTNGTVVYSATAASTLTYTFVLAVAARCAWITLGLDDTALGIVGASYTVAVDGGVAINGTTSKQSKRSGTGYNNGFGQVCVDLGVLSAGTHSVVITHAGTSGQYLYDDSILVESPTPMTVVLVKAYQLPASGYTAVGGSWATDQVYNAILDTVVGLFPSDGSVIAVDPNETGSGYDITTMIGSTDGLATHLNDIGEQWSHDWLMSKLNALPGRAGLNRPS